MIIGYARVSTTEQNLGLRQDDVKPAFDASVDVIGARVRNDHAPQRRPLDSRCSTASRNAAGVCCGDLFDVPLLLKPPHQRNDPAYDGDEHRDDLQHQLESD
jgi:hypothetical protein